MLEDSGQLLDTSRFVANVGTVVSKLVRNAFARGKMHKWTWKRASALQPDGEGNFERNSLPSLQSDMLLQEVFGNRKSGFMWGRGLERCFEFLVRGFLNHRLVHQHFFLLTSVVCLALCLTIPMPRLAALLPERAWVIKNYLGVR